MEMIKMNYEFCDGVTYTIKKGDTLYEISRKYRVPLALLLRANPYIDVFNLQVGDTICVPANPGQTAPFSRNMEMRPVDMENRRDETVQQPGVMRQPEDENMVDSDNMDETMREQPFANLQRKEDGCSQESVRDHEQDDISEDDKEECTKVWEKYVVQPGDTLADVMADMKGSIEEFVDKNGLTRICMLPGVAYYICK